MDKRRQGKLRWIWTNEDKDAWLKQMTIRTNDQKDNDAWHGYLKTRTMTLYLDKWKQGQRRFAWTNEDKGNKAWHGQMNTRIMTLNKDKKEQKHDENAFSKTICKINVTIHILYLKPQCNNSHLAKKLNKTKKRYFFHTMNCSRTEIWSTDISDYKIALTFVRLDIRAPA